MLMNMCQQITGAALSAYLPTILSENGFTGATAQIATLAPYGSAIVASTLTTVLFRQIADVPIVHDCGGEAFRQVRRPWMADAIRLAASHHWIRCIPGLIHGQQGCTLHSAHPR